MKKDIEKQRKIRALIGMNIAYWRKYRGMTQEKLAEASGLSHAMIAQTEAEGMDVLLSIDSMITIADCLNVKLYKFFVFDEDIEKELE
ncbi:helix-turn-helix transcriptional regulator [Oscillospiraceae bacterium OttesenSCG-928-F05]|nr:helix-turn-helix transcriptional regulator [Oscillospiraceae bacterium OttesenSCG-928-F05]